MPERRGDNSARLARARSIDLIAVMKSLGGQRDRYDRAKWRLDGHIISITGERFYDHALGQGGGGAIDLVMHLRGGTFGEALSYLEGKAVGEALPLPPGRSGAGVEDGSVPFAPPRNVPDHWHHVRTYLVEQRSLPTCLVDELHRQGLVYADERRNAVFLRRDEHGTPTGAALRGTHQDHPFKGLAAGTRRDAGWFYFQVGDRGSPQLILTESAIDTLSYYGLAHGNCPLAGSGAYREAYASTDGAGAVPHALIQATLERGGLVRVAFDGDEQGQRLWRALQERYQHSVSGARLQLWREIPPADHKDWSDVLKAHIAERSRDGHGR